MKKLLFTFCLFTLLACGDDDTEPAAEVTCPEEARYALRITVRNTADNSLLEGVSIKAREDGFEEILISESPGVYVGLEDRSGTYALIIEKENFQTIIEPPVTSEEMDACGLSTKELSFELSPL